MATKTRKAKGKATKADPYKFSMGEMEDGIRIGLHRWWHETRHLLQKMQTEAAQMAKEIEDNQLGPLAAVLPGGDVTLCNFVRALGNVEKEYLHDIVIAGKVHIWAPGARMYDGHPELNGK